MSREEPIHIDWFIANRTTATAASVEESANRPPVRPIEIWNEFDNIPSTPDPGLTADGNAVGVVTLRVRLPLAFAETTPAGADRYTTAPSALLSLAIPSSYSGSAEGALSGAPSTGYTPVIEDSNGTAHPATPAEWFIDGLDNFVVFPSGVPPDMVPPLTLTFFKYTGETGGGGGSAGHVWLRSADPVGGQYNIAPDPAFPTGAGDYLVFPAGSSEGARKRLLFDTARGAFRAGEALASEWDAANRGIGSAAFGEGVTASGSYSVALGNGGTASGDYCIAAGDGAQATGFGSVAIGVQPAVSGNRAAALGGQGHNVDGAFSIVLGGVNSNVTAGGTNSLVAGTGGTAAHPGTFVWCNPDTPHTSAFANEVTFGAEGGFRVLLGGSGTPAYAGGALYVDGAAVVTGNLTAAGNADVTGDLAAATLGASAVVLDDSASAPVAPAVGQGTLWSSSASGRPQFSTGGGALYDLAGYIARVDDPIIGAGQKNITLDPAATTNNEHFVFPNVSTEDNGGVSIRMMFDPVNGSFRAGLTTAQQWNSVNRGAGSIGLGEDTVASGNGAISIGTSSVASASTAIALGWSNTASGIGSMAVGVNATASHNRAFVWGDSLSFAKSSTADSEVTFGAEGGFRVLLGGSGTPAYAGGAMYVDGDAVVTGELAATASLGAPTLILTDSASIPVVPPAASGALWSLAPSGRPVYSTAGGAFFDLAGYFIRIADPVIGITQNNITLDLATTDEFDVFVLPANSSEGVSNRLMFSGQDASFRAGRVNGPAWDAANRGAYSAALGLDNTASAICSTATGRDTVASGGQSFATGRNTVASGGQSFAAGFATVASGEHCAAFGHTNTVSGDYAFATGSLHTVSGSHGFAAGSGNQVTGTYAAALCRGATVAGIEAAALGGNSHAVSGDYSVAVGGVNLTTAVGASYSLAAGWTSQAAHPGTFVWSTPAGAKVSTAANEVTFGAEGGFRVLLGGVGTPAYAGGVMYVDGDTVITGSTTSGGRVFAPNGTAGAPAYTFSADTDTGIYRGVGSNSVCLCSGGVCVAEADPAGFKAPTVLTNTINELSNNVGVTIDGVVLKDGGATATGAFLGKVGLPGSPAYSFAADTDSGLYLVAPGALGVTAGSVQAVQISADSTVLYGQLRASIGSASAPGISFSTDPNTGIYGTGSDQLGFSVGGVSRASLNSTGLTLSSGAVRLPDGILAAPALTFANVIGGSAGFYLVSGYQIRVVSRGAVCLYVSDTNCQTVSIYGRNDNLYTCGDPVRRWTAVYAVNGMIQTSDARMKNSVADLPADLGLSFVESLRPVTYKWNDTVNTDEDTGEVTTITHSRTHLGFIAQEVESTIAATGRTLSDIDLVDNDALMPGAPPDATDRYGMRPAQLIPILIKAIQELSTTLNATVSANAALEARVAALEAAP